MVKTIDSKSFFPGSSPGRRTNFMSKFEYTLITVVVVYLIQTYIIVKYLYNTPMQYIDESRMKYCYIPIIGLINYFYKTFKK